jgi:hypothetical protein
MGREGTDYVFHHPPHVQGGRKPDLERVQRALGVAERERPLTFVQLAVAGRLLRRRHGSPLCQLFGLSDCGGRLQHFEHAAGPRFLHALQRRHFGVLPDPFLRRAAAVVELDNPLGGSLQVGDDEADARSSPWCHSTLATTRRGLLQLCAW